MSKVTRISISVEEELIENFDEYSSKQGFPTRSEAIKNLIREALIKDEWTKGTHIAGAISMVFDHHKSQVVQKLLLVEHDFCQEIQCSQHVHLDHQHCMEIIVVRGKRERIELLLQQLRRIKGLKHLVLTMSTTGEHLH